MLQPLTSAQLHLGVVYSRAQLAQIFSISDATLKNGVFQPKGTRSVWLFVTEEKTADRTQYRDRLVGGTLYWQGQTQGRTDSLIIEHQNRGLEILLFYRLHKLQYAQAGFRYEGPFCYQSHSGAKPTNFVLVR